MFLPLEAIAKTMELSQWIQHSGFARCTVAIFDVLSPDAPSEPVSFVVQSHGKYSIRPRKRRHKCWHWKSPMDCNRGKTGTHQFVCHND
jgi:hypothetical protein